MNTQEKFNLTKREQFAMAAMQGLCADPSIAFAAIVTQSVKIADALLAELAKADGGEA